MDPINFINTGIVADQNKKFFDNFYGIPQNLQFNNTVAPVPLASASTMFQDLYYPNLGIMNQAPGVFLDDAGLPPIDTSFGVANEPDDEDDKNKAKETRTGIETLLSFLQNIPTPMNLITGGLQGIQNFSRGLQNTTFGRSKTLADYFDRVAREKNRVRFQDKFEKFAKETSGQGATGGEGGFSTPAGKSTSYEEASRAFGRDR